MDYLKKFKGVPSILFSHQRPPWSLMDWDLKLFAVGLAVRSVFMVLKGLMFVLKSIQVGLLYRKTYKRCAQFETTFLFFSAIKIIILIPNVFLYNINWMFYVLAMNSALAYTLSYELRRRTTTL